MWVRWVARWVGLSRVAVWAAAWAAGSLDAAHRYACGMHCPPALLPRPAVCVTPTTPACPPANLLLGSAGHDGLPVRRVHTHDHGLRDGGAGEAGTKVSGGAQNRQGDSGNPRTRVRARGLACLLAGGSPLSPVGGQRGAASVAAPARLYPPCLLIWLAQSINQPIKCCCCCLRAPLRRRTRAWSGCRARTRARMPTTACASASSRWVGWAACSRQQGRRALLGAAAAGIACMCLAQSTRLHGDG